MSTPSHRAGESDCSQKDSHSTAATTSQEHLASRRNALRLFLTAPALSLSGIVSAKEMEKPKEKKSAKTPTVDLKGTVFEKVGKSASIDPYLLYSICCVETAIDGEKTGYIRPYPWTLRHGNRPFYGKSKAHAERELKRILGTAKKVSVDIGIAQVNAFWHGHRVKSPFDLLDPQINLTIAAQILNENFRRYPKDAFKAIGAYHSREPSKSFRYAQYVIRVYSALKGV